MIVFNISDYAKITSRSKTLDYMCLCWGSMRDKRAVDCYQIRGQSEKDKWRSKGQWTKTNHSYKRQVTHGIDFNYR